MIHWLLAQGIDNRGLFDVTMIAAAVVALFGALVAIIRHTASETEKREARMAAEAEARETKISNDAKVREEKMAAAIGEMEQFQRNVLLNLVKSNQEVMGETNRLTNELRREIHELRMESKERRKRDGDSGILPST